MARRRIVISVRGVFGKGFLTTMSMKQAKRRLASAVRKYGYGNVMRRPHIGNLTLLTKPGLGFK